MAPPSETLSLSATNAVPSAEAGFVVLVPRRSAVSVPMFIIGSLLVHGVVSLSVSALETAPAVAKEVEFMTMFDMPEPAKVLPPKEPVPEPERMMVPVTAPKKHRVQEQAEALQPARQPSTQPRTHAAPRVNSVPSAQLTTHPTLAAQAGPSDAAFPVATSAPSASPSLPEGPAVDRRGLARGWLKQVQKKISKPRYPRSAIRADATGTVMLAIKVDEAGTVVSVRVKRSSGHASLDEAARANVIQIGRVLSPPTALAWKTREITLPVVFKLAEQQ